MKALPSVYGFAGSIGASLPSAEDTFLTPSLTELMLLLLLRDIAQLPSRCAAFRVFPLFTNSPNRDYSTPY